MRNERIAQAEPGAGERLRLALLSWPFLLALGLLLLNDHYLKAAFPGFISGKLSDVAGIFGVGLIAFALRRNRPWLITIVLFSLFLWWKSPASQSFIDAIRSLGYMRIGRTIDYADLGAFVVLPLAWQVAGRPDRFQLLDRRLSRVMTIPVLVTSALAVAATSPPVPGTAVDVWVVRPARTSPPFRWSEVSAAVDAAAVKHDMRTRNWRPNAEHVRYMRRLVSLDWELKPDGSVKLTLIGEYDDGLFLVDDVPKMMAALKNDVNREFHRRFGNVESADIPTKCSCAGSFCPRSACTPVGR